MIVEKFRALVEDLRKETGYRPVSIVVELPYPLYERFVVEVAERCVFGVTPTWSAVESFSIDGVTTFKRGPR